MNLPILFQDETLVAVHKNSGLLVHRSLIDRHETEFALQMVRDQVGRHVYPVHRLDRSTSGVLLFALDPETARAMAEKFARGEVNKEYLAVVRGIPQSPQLIDYALKEEPDAKSDRKARANKPAQSAQTQIECVSTIELPVQVDRYPTSRYSLVRARPLTGRKHQIRRHLRHVGSPLIGDVTYGVGKHNRFFEQNFKIRRLLLACMSLSFTHPVTDLSLHIEAPLAADLARLFEQLGWAQYV